MVCCEVRGGALFILLQVQYEAWRQLHAGKTVMLSFHAKGEYQRLTSGAGRPASPRPAGLGVLPRGHRPSDSGSDHFLQAVGSWSCVGFAVARPAGLPLAHLGL